MRFESVYPKPEPLDHIRQDLPVPAAGTGYQSAQNGVGCGYYVYLDEPRLHVFSGRDGLAYPQSAFPAGVHNTMETDSCIEALTEAIER